jgi:hypothetical protein
MTTSTQTQTPTDRASFNNALAAIHADHATLRRLATCATRQPELSTDAILSLVDAMAAHEQTEASLFSLPFLTRTPETVTSSAARARRRCLEYTSGNFDLPDSTTASALLVEALLLHLAAEEGWLAHEMAEKNERLWTSI